MTNTATKTILAAAAVCIAGAAHAGSPIPVYVEPEPYIPVQPEPTWEGGYAGVIGGFQTGDVTDTVTTVTSSFDATTYGVMAGYNFQKDQVVYGGEIDVQLGSGSLDAPVGANNAVGVDFDVDYLIDLRGRLGFATDNVLVYAAAGFTTAKITVAGGGSFEGNGWNAGLGVDFGVTEDVFLGGEYIYRDLSGENALANATDLNSHGFQVRLGYRF